LKNKGKLLELAREKVYSEGYNFAKKRSRLKKFGTEKDLEAENKTEKRQNMTDDIHVRQKTIQNFVKILKQYQRFRHVWRMKE
jgi:hypothetical protein